jgi:hypothetical protein
LFLFLIARYFATSEARGSRSDGWRSNDDWGAVSEHF